MTRPRIPRASASAFAKAMLVGLPFVIALVGSLTLAIAALPFTPPNWVVAAAPVVVDLKSVAFTDAESGYAVGAGGAILRTADAGATWSAVPVETSATLNAVDSLADGASWAVGEKGTVLSSVDGTSWNVRASGVATDLLGVDFADATHGWAVGRGGTMIVTADGGSTWATQSAGVLETLRGVAFASDHVGWAWGDCGVVARTTDAGSSWTAEAVAAEDVTLYAGAFLDARTGWVAGSGGVIRKTADGGATWTTQTVDTTASIYSITFTDAEHGFLVGGDSTSTAGIVAGTANGGATWTLQTLDTAGVYRAVSFSDPGHGLIVGDGGTLLRTVPKRVPEPIARTSGLSAPVAVYARAMQSGEVLLGWTECGGASAPTTYRVWRSVSGGDFASLALVRATDGAAFTDTSAPPLKLVAYRVSTIDPTGESSASASTSVGTPDPPALPGDRPSEMSCTGCHTVHYALPDDEYPGVAAACVGCHPEIGERLSGEDASTRHDLRTDDQSAHGSRIACENCHNAHVLSKATPIADPDDPSPLRGTPRVTDGFCLTCHDESLPAPAMAPSPLGPGGVTVAGDIAATWVSDVHGGGHSAADPELRSDMGYAVGDELACVTCHDPHGSTNRWALLESVPSKDGARRASGALVRPLTGGGADLRLLCAGCHSLASHPDASEGGADLSLWPVDCTGCHAHGRGL